MPTITVSVEYPQCDFCNSRYPAWRWPCRTFAMPAENWQSVEDWSACDECNSLIVANKWDALAQRSLVTHPDYPRISIFAHLLVLAKIKELHEQFKANRMTTAPLRIDNPREFIR